MKNSFRPYQTLTNEMENELNIELNDYSFFYNSNDDEENEEKQIIAEFDGASQKSSDLIMLSTKDSNYNSDINNLIVRNHITINNPSVLFGEKGLADNTTVLGLALTWSSKTSSQRGVSKIGEINYNDTHINYDIYLKFLPKQIRGEISIKLILYVKEASTNTIPYFASQKGIIVGLFDEISIAIDGSGSVFPIVTIFKPNEPLWTLNCEWTDPTQDAFSTEYVQICINSAHPDYPLLNMDDGGIFTSPLLKEIISNALSMIISLVKDDPNSWSCVFNNDFEEGSICAAIKYFLDTFNWKYGSTYELSYSIRKRFDSLNLNRR